ncbi:MAG: DUF2017 domain-containing protein [Actinobacteria bacterium]|nr:DUF2017 domain-containing protein [Actinomycetota bacterium]MCB8996461.1 DUF2017 domain-containing protein [Actinomycetota bacterium]MCB9425281.1 DUF2017 domain-containing protein [Actinomycetota bacterium]HRY08759.1 DUF2017 family protein [Candidatus Nanopelagicales bacterium]
MGKPFKVKKGEMIARLDGQERQVLAFVCDELSALLADPVPDPDVPDWARELGLSGVGESRPTPQDPVIARLLPDAYDDPERASEFRRLTESELRATKLAHVAVVRAQVQQDPIIITDDVQAWLAFLADARLMLGTRLGVTEDDELVPTNDPEHNLYLYLGYLQQTLVEELIGG